MSKTSFIDIGELGWSLYLSAHLRWRKEKNNESFAVFTSPNRFCLYKDIADEVLPLPAKYYSRFKTCQENCSGLKGVHRNELEYFFKENLPRDYSLSNLPLGCYKDLRVGPNKIYAPYPYSKRIEGRREIIVLPRHREAYPFSLRNLPERFYIKMVRKLCDTFPRYLIRTMGIPFGSYSMDGIMRDNYINGVSQGNNLQDIIDRCQVAICSIGGTSSLPKLAMLQGVPSFIIGHEPERFKIQENWRSTKMEFFFVKKGQYNNFDFEDCIVRIISFIKEVQ